MIEAVEKIVRIEEEIAAARRGEKTSASGALSASTSTAFSAQRQPATTDRDGLLKYVVFYARNDRPR
jgi:hypothetical protein